MPLSAALHVLLEQVPGLGRLFLMWGGISPPVFSALVCASSVRAVSAVCGQVVPFQSFLYTHPSSSGCPSGGLVPSTPAGPGVLHEKHFIRLSLSVGSEYCGRTHTTFIILRGSF